MKKLMIIILAVALFATLKATNPTIEEFGRYYDGREWKDQEGFMDSLPDAFDGLTEHFLEGEIRQDYAIFSVYNFGGRLFLGAAGGFKLMA